MNLIDRFQDWCSKNYPELDTTKTGGLRQTFKHPDTERLCRAFLVGHAGGVADSIKASDRWCFPKTEATTPYPSKSDAPEGAPLFGVMLVHPHDSFQNADSRIDAARMALEMADLNPGKSVIMFQVVRAYRAERPAAVAVDYPDSWNEL